MKRALRIGTALALLCLTIFLLASCLLAPKYEITFVVEGEETVVTCREGKTPQFPGEVTRSSDSEYTYLFAGWDTEIAPASANVTYTARFVRYARDLVKITFVVDGNTQVAYFDKGKMPDYEQVLLPDEWSERYVVTEWDKPLSKVTGEETYTATAFTKTARETVRVTWTADTVYYMDVLFGALPKAPEIEDWDTAKYHNEFLRWNKEVLPACEEIYYKAVVKKSVRSYDVTFVVGDETETHTLLFGEMPEYSKGDPVLNEKPDLTSWDKPIVEVTGDETYTAIEAAYPPILTDKTLNAFVDYYLNTRIVYYAGDNPNSSSYFTPATMILMIALEENRCPGRFENQLRDAVLANINSILYSGKEHLMDACCYWSYPIVTGLFYVVKSTPTLWDNLTEQEQKRCDRMMMAYTCLAAFATDDRNNYTTGPGLKGNYNKDWNPNYRLANVMPILNCLGYFGSAEAVNEILANFDYDEYIDAFQLYGWNNMYTTWTAENSGCSARAVLTNGGKAYHTQHGYVQSGGSGVGVKVPGGYQYKGYSLDEPGGIFNHVMNYCFAGGDAVNDSSKMGARAVFTQAEYDAWKNTDRAFSKDLIGEPKMQVLITDDTPENPVLGLDGMMLEWNSGDGEGFRSSGSYCAHDYIMAEAMLAINRLGGWWDPADYPETASRIYVGMTDTQYKLEQGVYGFSLGNRYFTKESNYGGYQYCKDAWTLLYGPELRKYLITD